MNMPPDDVNRIIGAIQEQGKLTRQQVDNLFERVNTIDMEGPSICRQMGAVPHGPVTGHQPQAPEVTISGWGAKLQGKKQAVLVVLAAIAGLGLLVVVGLFMAGVLKPIQIGG